MYLIISAQETAEVVVRWWLLEVEEDVELDVEAGWRFGK